MSENFRYFVDNQRELVRLYRGKYIVIHHCAVVGMFDDDYEGRKWARDKFPEGGYCCYWCIPGTRAYTI